MENLSIYNYVADLSDTDLYKLTMQQAYIMKYNKAKLRYKFYLRSDISFPEGFGQNLQELVQQMKNITLSNEMYLYLSKIRFFTPFYLEYLKSYKFNPAEVMIFQENGNLQIIIEGYSYRTVLWETPLLAIISQLYFEMTGADYNEKIISTHTQQKANLASLNGLIFTDFGTRRRRSLYHHINTIKIYKNRTAVNEVKNGGIIGTSNPYIGNMFNLICTGTHAHEWFMFHCIAYSFEKANHFALEAWSDVYDGDLGIALTDTLTTDIFLWSFKGRMAHLFNGVRHDSGDPINFGEKIIEHYKSINIDPSTKQIIFSDALNFKKAQEIKEHFYDYQNNRTKIKCGFGIGTYITNDIPEQEPLSIVIKLDAVKIDANSDWKTVIKLSDNIEKHTGDPEKIELVKKLLKIKDDRE